MRKGFSKSEAESWRETLDSDKYCLGNLDLLNLRLDFPPDEIHNRSRQSPRQRKLEKGCGDTNLVASKRHHHPLAHTQTKSLIPNLGKLPRGYAKSQNNQNPQNSSDNLILLYSKDKSPELVFTEPISRKDFLFPSKKKTRKQVIDVVSEDRMSKFNSKVTREDSGNFPFKQTPSGNLKVQSQQVVFASNKLSVLVADPLNTKVNIHTESIHSKMAQDPTEFSKTSAMDTIMSQAGFSSLGSLIGNTPVRSGNKEASEYESKQTSEILDPELNLGRLGYSGTDNITWDKVALPEKKNLYLELYSRITNYINADCKVYIDNEEFNCHLIVLQCYSELFDAYIAVKKVEIPSDKCSASSFAFIYEWMITGEPSYRDLNRENVLDIFNSAKYLKIKDLVEQCWAFIDNTDVFNEDTGFLLYMDAKKKSLPEVRELMLPRIQGFFLMLVSSQDWLELELEDVKNLLKSNYICVNCEMEIFMSAVRWLKHDWASRDPCKYEILDCVRFGNIAPWQLVDIKRNPENPDFMELAKDGRICKMIDDGLAFVIIKYWYGQENDDFQHWNTVLGLQEPPPRNWSGSDKTYFTYREFLIYLDQYRRNQLIEKNKPKMMNEKKFNPELGKAAAGCVQEKISPRVPTMDEFLSKKKSKPLRRNLKKPKQSGSSSSKKEEQAARVIQSAYKLFREKERKCSQKLNHETNAKQLQNKKILELFVKKQFSKPPTLDHEKAKYLTEISLFQKDKETVLVFGGLDPHSSYGVGRNTSKNIFRYVTDANIWEYVGDLPQPRHQHCVQFLKGRVYLVGGSDPRNEEESALDSVWSFNPITRTWFSEPSLNVARKNFGLVVCNKNMFAIGGQSSKQDCLKSVEKFNYHQGVWEKKASMLTPRAAAACSKYLNYIWVAGGYSAPKNNAISSVESYNLKTNQWTEVTRLTAPRCFSSMFLMSDRVYIIGGVDKLNKLNNSIGSVEVWDQKSSTWESVTELSIPRHGHSLAYLGTQIFIIGGLTTVYMRALSNIECFCSKRGIFIRGISCLPSALSGHAAVSLPPAMLMSS